MACQMIRTMEEIGYNWPSGSGRVTQRAVFFDEFFCFVRNEQIVGNPSHLLRFAPRRFEQRLAGAYGQRDPERLDADYD